MKPSFPEPSVPQVGVGCRAGGPGDNWSALDRLGAPLNGGSSFCNNEWLPDHKCYLDLGHSGPCICGECAHGTHR